MAPYSKVGKKHTQTPFNANRKQSLLRPTLKNADPFPRNSRHPAHPIRKTAVQPTDRRNKGNHKTAPYATRRHIRKPRKPLAQRISEYVRGLRRRSRRRTRGVRKFGLQRTKRRARGLRKSGVRHHTRGVRKSGSRHTGGRFHKVRRWRLKKNHQKKYRRLSRKPRKKVRFKGRPFRLWSTLERKRYRLKRMKNPKVFYWRKFHTISRRGAVKTVTARREFLSRPHLRTYGAGRIYSTALHVVAKRVLTRAYLPVIAQTKPTKEKYNRAKFKKRYLRMYNYMYYHRGGTEPTETEVIRPAVQLRLKSTQQRGTTYSLRARTLRKLVAGRDRRKGGKRRRVTKRPQMRKRLKRRAFARQLIRKLRSVQRTATRALRRRLLRHKRRYYRKARSRFNVIRYTRRLRVKRRVTRRVRRYIRTTATILRGARARILNRRSAARKQRISYLQVSQRGRLLLRSAPAWIKHARRQQLFVRKEQRRRMRALRLLTSRALSSSKVIKKQSWIRARRAVAKLRRRLAGYISVLTPRLPRARSELTPATFKITPTWLLRRHQRVRRRRLKLPYLTTNLSHLKQHSMLQASFVHILRQLPVTASARNRFYLRTMGKGKQLQRRVNRLALRAHALSVRATLAAFRAYNVLTASGVKNVIQASRAAALTLRRERTQLLESRYYLTRAKLRLPGQRVQRAERKRQGLKLFARHTLKKPTTTFGRAKLLLPALAKYTVAPWQTSSASAAADKDVSVPNRMKEYHPRVHFRGPRRYELGLVLSSRLRRLVKKSARHQRFLRRALKKRKSTPTKTFTQPNPEKLTAALKKVQTMDSASFTKMFFKKLTFTSATQQDAAKALFLSRLQAACFKLSSLKRLTTKATRNSRRAVKLERLALKATRFTNTRSREAGLWHLRSVQKMLNRERALSAWSPQYGTKFRRWSSPRRYGRPIRTPKLSRLARKIRRLVNKALANRNKPKRKYFDRSFGRLQYYRGSAASLGYARYRRVYRPRSKNNRWWKPLKHAVPFVHPYSRRSLNASKGVQVNLEHTTGYRRGGGAGRTDRISSRTMLPEGKPRMILSSTIKFKRKRYETRQMFLLRVKKDRAQMPFTMQRWLPVRLKAAGKVQASTNLPVTLARTRRSIRKLERTFPKSNAWAGRRWEALNRSHSTTSAAALFTAALNQLSGSFWTRLRACVGSPSKRAALQRSLFIRFRSWQTSTLTTPAVGGLDYARSLELAVKFIAATFGELLHETADSSFYSDLVGGAFTRRLTSKQQRSWKVRNLSKTQKINKGRSTSIYNKRNNMLRRRWLHGAERYLKRSRVGRLPPRHRRGGDRRMTAYGRTRRRFPASGRRKQSYDSMLHAFAKRTSPSRFRRAAVTRFKRIHPKLTRDSKFNRRMYELSRRRRVQRTIAHTLSRVAYLSPNWRELLTFRENSPLRLPTVDYAAPAEDAIVAARSATVKNLTPYSAQYGQPHSAISKRRFASLPVNVIFKRAQLARRLLRPSGVLPLRAHRIGLLRAALRRRRMERIYVDLKKHVSRRRLSKEQLAPTWKRRKLARKREKYLRYGEWTSRHFSMAPVKNLSWTLHSLEERAPRRQDRALDVSLRGVAGEVLLLTPRAAKRRNWAKRGFRIQLTAPKVKARRSRRVIRRRRRRSRRPGLGGWVKLNHWIERKNYTRILARGRWMHGAAGRLAAKQAFSSRVGLRFQKKLPIQGMFKRSKTNLTKTGLPRGIAFRAAVLTKFSSAARRRGLKRLQRRAAHRRSKFLRRKVGALRRQQLITTNNKAVARLRQFASRALQPFTESLVPRSTLAPLTFVRRTQRVVKSDAEKRRAVVWNIKNKEIRYKKTAQYTESLTRFIPALMSYMISRHVNQKKLAYSYVKGLISATYWNLRIYLNVDPFAKRLVLRDRNFQQLRFLAKAITRLAKEQVTEHADRTRLRWRFQPCRLQPAPSSDRFRLDWLRAFFPRKHALYQEDPEYYSRAILSSRNIRRVPLTGYGIGRARTYSPTISVERRARHLLRMRLSRREPRLETVLQTTRRIPETELEQFVPTLTPDSEEVVLEKERVLAQQIAEADAAIFARSKKFVFVKKARAPKLSAAEIAAAEIDQLLAGHIAERNPLVSTRVSFFQRSYSTTTSRALISTAKLISLQGRLSAADGEQSTAFSELSARTRVKARLVARGRTNFIAATDFMINAGGLDPRFLRYKSPRSRQYGIRKPAVTATKKITLDRFTELARFHQKRESLWTHQENKQVIRLRRRHFYLDTPTIEGTRTTRVLTTARMSTPSRRTSTVLSARRMLAQHQVLNVQLRNFPNRQQLIFNPLSDHNKAALFRNENRFFELRPLLKGQLSQYWRSHLGKVGVVNGERAALLYRTPAQRSVSSTYRADRVLGYRPIRPRRGVIALSRSGKRAFRVFGKVQRRYKRALEGLRFAWMQPKFKSEFKVRRAATALARFQRNLSSNKLRNKIYKNPFRTTSLQRLARLSRFTRRCIIRQRINYQTPFDTFRPQLWHMLTHRWMKKHRTLKEWLKDVNLWFKDPWLSLLVDPSRRGKRVPGEIRAREQQDGEIVTGRENAGYTGAEKAARVKAAHRAIAGALSVVKKDIEHTKRYAERASTSKKAEILRRLERSRQVLRKPRPSMWLANLQCKRWVAEKAAWIVKPKAEKRAHLLERKKASIARVQQGKRPLGPKAAPLKVPANHFIPHVIWKDIQRRVRRLTWRESDDAFTRRGFRNAFKFYPAERNRAPWLEALMYNRSLYSTNLREFRRRQFPREQKKYKWLQRVRKSLFPGRTNTYIKGRRWPRIRMYNQRLHYSLFSLPDRNAARRHFKKLGGRSRTIGFVHFQEGLSNRLDNVLIHLNMAPTIFWARHVATRGLLRVNGKIAYGADYRLKAGDFIEPVWDKVIKYRHFFKNPLHRREEKLRHNRWSLTGVPRNFEYHPTIRCYTFLGNPREEDLRQSSRLQPHLFRWFRLDSGAKKSVT